MKRLLPCSLTILGLCLTAEAPAADWPQYRYDSARSAASPEQLPAALSLQWLRRLPAPRPAFPSEVRLRFDASYEPIVLGKSMFVPSMVTDSLTALDIETGAERWRFFAEGPVRFAPVAWEGNVYFISDDGYLYCVDAADGTLRWKFRQLPPGKSDRKILGGGRLISLWPARGGPVLQDGIIYFGAGLWSAHGAAIHALDAKSGRVIWSNAESNQIPEANMDHGIANLAGLTPQGYLAIVHDRLVVPCGPQLPAFLDLRTGKLGTYSMGWGGRNGLPKGTWFVAGAGNYLSNSGDLYDITRTNDEHFDPKGSPDFKKGRDFKSMLYPGAFTRLQINPTNQKDLGDLREPVFAAGVMYDSAQDIVAYDLSEAKLQERSKAPIAEDRRNDIYPDKWKADFREIWRLASPLKVYIKAGQQLYVGGPGTVGAVAIPQGGAAPQVTWQAAIEGTPQRMLAADGKLFVVTREGTIYAFGGQPSAKPIVHAEPKAPLPPTDQWTKTAADILQTTKVRDGYALVLGIGTGRLAEEVVRRSKLDVIAIDPDSDKVAEFRQRLHRAGLYGTRVSVHLGAPLSYPLPPYLASLIISEDWALLNSSGSRTLADAILHPLRPYGGTACVALPAAERDALVNKVADSGIAGATARQAGDWVLVSRVGPLPGSANWSHDEADAANTGASEERFLKAPLELLWFDAPPRWTRTVGATLVRISDGRMLLKAKTLQAFDVFTGRRLWETALPFSHNTTDQLVALEDAIYVAGGSTCLVLDPATGQKTRQIELPAGLTGVWLNLRAWQNYLVGQSGKHLVCVDRQSGQVLWQHECGRENLSIALGGGKVFCAELFNKRRGETADNVKTRALDIRTGDLLWQIAGGSEVRCAPALDRIVMSSGIYRAKDGSLVVPLPEESPGDEKKKPENLPKPLFVIGEKLLFGTAESFKVYDLRSGDHSADTMTWTRRGCTIARASSNFVTTRYRGNAACIDLASREIIPFWNVRAACSNNLFPANGVLNMPALMGGCTCNYLPVAQAFVPASVIQRPGYQC